MRKDANLTFPETKRVDVADAQLGVLIPDPYGWPEGCNPMTP